MCNDEYDPITDPVMQELADLRELAACADLLFVHSTKTTQYATIAKCQGQYELAIPGVQSRMVEDIVVAFKAARDWRNRIDAE